MILRAQRDEGFALITVLWAALILALAASYIVLASRTDARIANTTITQAQGAAVAEGVIELTKLRLLGSPVGAVALDVSISVE